MAMCDYLLCAKCGCKTIYDAEVDYAGAVKYKMIADIAALCQKCAKTHKLAIVEEPTVTPLADFLAIN